jgi:hypothetical protein
MSLNVSALADFNNEVAGLLLPKMIYAGNTAEYVTVKEGIKYKEPLNLFEVDLQIQDGFGCVTNPSGSATFSQRDLEVCQRTSYDGLCLKDMDKKYLGISALEPGSYNETFAMANTYAELLVNQFQKSNDQFIWAAQSGSNACVSGLKTIISGSTTGVAVPDGFTGSFDASTALDRMDAAIAGLSSDVADRDDLTFFMSVSNFRKYVTAIRTENSFYFDPESITNRGNTLDMMYPFQNIRVVGTVGLQGSDRIVLGPAKHIVIGTDLTSDLDEFQMWYDINSDQLKHRINTKLGVNIAYPEFWVSNDLA